MRSLIGLLALALFVSLACSGLATTEESNGSRASFGFPVVSGLEALEDEGGSGEDVEEAGQEPTHTPVPRPPGYEKPVLDYPRLGSVLEMQYERAVEEAKQAQEEAKKEAEKESQGDPASDEEVQDQAADDPVVDEVEPERVYVRVFLADPPVDGVQGVLDFIRENEGRSWVTAVIMWRPG